MYVRIYLSNPALHPSETLHLNRNLRDKFKRGRGCRGATSPIKIISKSPDLQNDLLAPKNRLNASRYVSEPPSFCLHVPHFYLRLLVIFAGLMAPLQTPPSHQTTLVALVGDYTMKNCNQREVCLIDNFS